MWKFITILVIVALISLIWWNMSTKNSLYFDGETVVQIPKPLFIANKNQELSFSLRFANVINDGFILLMKSGDDFQIIYVQNGKVILNSNNDQLVILKDDIKSNRWTTFSISIPNKFKGGDVYFGANPLKNIPVNNLSVDESPIVQFPTSGLIACTSDCYLDDVNLSTLFKNEGIPAC